MINALPLELLGKCQYEQMHPQRAQQAELCLQGLGEISFALDYMPFQYLVDIVWIYYIHVQVFKLVHNFVCAHIYANVMKCVPENSVLSLTKQFPQGNYWHYH